MNKIQKLKNNIISRRAISVLGVPVYAKYILSFLLSVPKIIKAGDFRPLDKSMGSHASRFYYRGSTILLDCQFCDDHLDEDSFAFGIAREIYIRDCYFKWHPKAVYENAKTVVDLGANRGVFSTLMTSQAESIVCVECGEQYPPVIKHNMEKNKYKSYSIETAYIGEGGTTESETERITVNELRTRHNIKHIDLMKMDIEGSEFALFESADWLEHVGAISMEVHPGSGNPNDILKTLDKHGFSCVAADENLGRLKDATHANFIYAWRNDKYSS